MLTIHGKNCVCVFHNIKDVIEIGIIHYWLKCQMKGIFTQRNTSGFPAKSIIIQPDNNLQKIAEIWETLKKNSSCSDLAIAETKRHIPVYNTNYAK